MTRKEQWELFYSMARYLLGKDYDSMEEYHTPPKLDPISPKDDLDKINEEYNLSGTREVYGNDKYSHNNNISMYRHENVQ